MLTKDIVFPSLLALSVLCWLVPALLCLFSRLIKGASIRTERRPGISRILTCSLILLASVWCLRYAVGYYDGALTPFEEAFNSLLHALQTFTLDEDYTHYTLRGKEILGELFGAETPLRTVYGIYASLIGFLTPMIGGAFLFEILANIFPKLRLICSYLAFWREKYFFSELNEMSLALAADICAKKGRYLKRPVLVFTDTYTDEGEEKETELLASAKLLGAICLKDDLLHVRKNRFGERKFFLTDQREADCLQKLVGLSDAKNAPFLRNAEVFFFVKSDAYVQLEQNIVSKLLGEHGFSEEELPALIPVQGSRNLICNLLVDIPLFEPLIGQTKENKQLTVTIVGAGETGMEMLLSSYWFGQILDTRLKLHVISEAPKEAFLDRLDAINPELRRTTDEKDPILLINRRGEMSPPYAEITYTQCNVRSSQFIACLKEGAIAETDYFLVSLGSDEKNIETANTIKKHLGEHRLSEASGESGASPRRTVVAYVVYDPELSDALNRDCHFSFAKGTSEMYFRAIGNLREVYSEENVAMTKYREAALRTDESYHALQGAEHKARRARDAKKRLKDDYSFWANYARAMHLSYKAFSAGMLTASLFDQKEEGGLAHAAHKAYQEVRARELLRYQEYICSPSGDEEKLRLLHRLAWLEHRRWCAFLRMKGFRGTSDYDAYAVPGVSGSYKQLKLKLHPCLLECDDRGIRAVISPAGVIDKRTLLRSSERESFDLLDELSYDLNEKGINNYDFKQYDYPREDFG